MLSLQGNSVSVRIQREIEYRQGLIQEVRAAEERARQAWADIEHATSTSAEERLRRVAAKADEAAYRARQNVDARLRAHDKELEELKARLRELEEPSEGQ